MIQRFEYKILKKFLKDYLILKGINPNEKFRCLNPAHYDLHPSMQYDEKNLRVKCFSCGVAYDVLDLLEMETGLHGAELFDYACKIFNLESEKNLAEDRKAYLAQVRVGLKGSAGEKYLLSRGLTTETLVKNNVGYDEKLQRIVFGYEGDKYFVTRNIQEKIYLKPKGENEPLYELGDKNSGLMFVVEGQIDALSLIQVGATRVVAIGGSGTKKLRELSPKPKFAVIVQDNDIAGKNTGENIKNEIEHQGIICLLVNPPSEFKDSNDILKADVGLLKELVLKWRDDVKLLKGGSMDNVKNFIRSAFANEIKNFQRYKEIRTGYANLDNEMILYPGLYVLGAISSLGKTTFAHQLADQLSEQGNHVLYFSLEQSRLELISKGISRLMAKKILNVASTRHLDSGKKSNSASTRNLTQSKILTAVEIMRGDSSDMLENTIDEYAEIGENENIIECNFETNIDDVISYVKNFIAENNYLPVVIVDYLQVLRPSEQAGVRESIDENVKKLKQLQTEFKLVLLVISSLNRLNYMNTVDFESFKESGGIEYTADVVWGLQLKDITKSSFEHKSVNEKREIVRQAKLNNPREIELICLKNRYGKSSYKCGFQYYTNYDLFIPDDVYLDF